MNILGKWVYKDMVSNRVHLILSVLIVFLIIPTVSADDWPMFGHDPANSNVAEDSVKPPLELLWSYKTSGNYLSSPAVSNNVVYVGSDDNHVYAINTKSGELLWKYVTKDSIRSSPAVLNDVVYVGSDDNHVYAIDTKSGELLWKYVTEDSVRSSPKIIDGLIYVGSDDNTLHVFSNQNGDLKWSYNLGNDIRSSPAISNDTVYVGSLYGSLYALNSKNGELKWEYRTMGSIESFPVISDDVVYVGSWDGFVYAFDTIIGDFKWKYKIGTDIILHIAAFDNVVYVTSIDSFVYAIDAETGTLLWKYDGDQSFSSSPIISNNAIYVGSNNGDLYVLDTGTGELIYKYDTGSSSISYVVISNGTIFTSSNNGNLSAFISKWVTNDTDVVSDFNNEKNNIDEIVLINEDESLSNNSAVIDEYRKDEKSLKNETLVTEVNQESNPDNYHFIDIFIYLFTGIVLSYFIFRNYKKNDATKSLEQFSFINGDYYNDFEAQKVYNDAEKAFDKGKYSKAMKLANNANDLHLKEEPLRILIKKIENKKRLEYGCSHSLLIDAEQKMKNAQFDDSKNILNLAEDLVNNENHILDKINQINQINQIHKNIPEIYQKQIKEINYLLDKSLSELREGKFESASSHISKAETMVKEEINNAEYEVKKNYLIEDIKGILK